MNIKVYKFSYGGTFKKAISKTVSLLYNSMIGGFVLFIYMLIIAKINYKVKYIVNDNNLNIFQLVEVLLGIVILSCFIIPSFFQQKVELSERIVRVYRHILFFSPFMIFRGFNDTILISQIKDVYRPRSKDKYLQPIPVNVIDWDNMVIIKLDNSLETIYYIPVENSDEFIDEVNKRRSELQKDKN